MEIENLDENAAWHKVFTSGSEALKSKLKKVHANNPKFQAFLRDSGYEEEKSAAQAKKDVAVINKAKAKAAEPKKVDRIELIKKAAEKRNARAQVAKHRAAWGGEVPGASYDDPIASARAGRTIRGYRLGEEHHDKDKRDAGHKMTPAVAAAQKKFDTQTASQTVKPRQAGASYGRYLTAARKKKLEEGRMKDIATDREETARLHAQKVLGGPVISKSTLPAGKRPAGQRRARSLARAALKNLLAQRKGK